MKTPLLALLLCLLSTQTFAAFSVVETRRMSPGVRYKKIVDASVPWEAFVLEIDLSDPLVRLQTPKAGNLLTAVQTPSQMIAANTSNDYHNVVGGINGDFFNVDGSTRNIAVADGEFVWSVSPLRSIFGIRSLNLPFISQISHDHTVVAANSATLAIAKINRPRSTDNLVLYNRFYGGATGTDTTGTEIKLAPKNGWRANGVVECTVLAKTGPGSGNMTFSAGQAVLSGHGTASTYLSNNFAVGDTISLILDGSAAAVEDVAQIVGGWPRIVNNGVNYAATGVIEESGPSLANERHPRSGIGYTQDNQTLYFAVVDGRRTGSAGMTLTELADFLLYLGVYQGMNLDGGGSSALIANGVTKNVPSDGSERPVGNSVLVYLDARWLDSFESGVGHFTSAPTANTTTVGVAATSSVTAQTTTHVHSGNGSLKITLNDNTSVTTPWVARLLSGGGTPANNTSIPDARGTISFYLKTTTAAAGASVRIWIDDTDGTEESPALAIINDGQWHRYAWDLENFSGAAVNTGNGRINGAAATLDSIVLAQPNTATAWTVYIDDLLHERHDVDAGLVNLASSATLSVDSTKDANTKDRAVDGNHSTSSSRWLSAEAAGAHWFQLDWPSARTINRVKVWSGSPPTAGWQIADFELQRWTGSAWATVASVTNNPHDAAVGACNDLSFAPISTTKLRLYITNPCVNPASDPLARLVELEVFGPNLATTATLSVNSTKDDYTKDRAVDGNKLASESRWISADGPAPHWFQLDWPAAKTISGAKIWSGSSSVGFQIGSFDLQYWNGSTWVTATSVANNTKDAALAQFNDLTFTPVSTTKLRMYITDPCANPASLEIARLLEIEVY